MVNPLFLFPFKGGRCSIVFFLFQTIYSHVSRPAQECKALFFYVRFQKAIQARERQGNARKVDSMNNRKESSVIHSAVASLGGGE